MNTLKTLIVALTITSGAVAQSDIYEVPQDFGPNDLWVSDPYLYSTGYDYVIVDAYSTMQVDVFWDEGLVNPGAYSWSFVNPTDQVMHWTAASWGHDVTSFELTMTLQHRAPAWGRNVSEISIDRNPIAVVPTPGAMALMGIGGFVARRRRRR